ncbi:MAG: type II secretion system F family protein [Candidatus Nomurabacteria bacterium]|jgi:type IV pilus assembly protein PilC|nr:type II secretion system F family protein [Candidatus Nomurabacteria bacterium]
MKRFDYKAHYAEDGRKVVGSIQAENDYNAGKLLVERGLVPDQIEEFGAAKSARRITGKDRIIFTRQFATLVGAGLPLSQSLATVAEQTANKTMRGVIEDILANVESGKTLANSFGRHPKVFNKVYLSIVAAGEVSGTLDDSLKRIAMQQEKDAAMMSKIKGAMVYPAIVLVVIGLVMAFMLFTVVPQVQNLYADLKQPLPFLTQVMVGMADFLKNFWWLVIGVLALAFFLAKNYFSTENGIKVKDTFSLNVPIFKGLFRRLYMARFARTAQILLKTGVPMLDAIHISADSVNNVMVKADIDAAADMVAGGKALSESLKNRDNITPFVPQMISIGEQSGKIDEMLGKVAQVYEDELDEQIRTISTMIEPILMVFLAVIAGGMIGAVLFPIYALVNKF